MAKLLIRIDDGLDELARRILEGEIEIVPDQFAPDVDLDTVLDVESLQGLARFCDKERLHVEAARIRRWLSPRAVSAEILSLGESQ